MTSAVGLERLEDRTGFVGHQPWKVDETAVAFDEGREHGAVGVDDSITLRPRSRGSSSLPVTTNLTRGRLNTGTSPTPIELRTPRSCGRSTLPLWSSVVPRTMSSPALPTFLPGETAARALTDEVRPGFIFDPFGGQHGVATGRQRRAGHDSNALANCDCALKRTSRK